MIRNHSLAFYDLSIAVQYRMRDFEEVKTHKKTGCIYSHGEVNGFKKIYIDTELSTGFRYEEWVGETWYCLELLEVSYSMDRPKEKINAFNVEVKITIMKDNVYEERLAHISDRQHFKLKSGAWTQNYMIEYGKEVFDFHKGKIVEMLESGIEQNFNLKIYKETFARSSFGC